MGTCRRISPAHRKLCAGDLIHEVQIINPSITPPVSGTVDYDITDDEATAPIIFASLKTPRGKMIFDGTGTERDITHEFGLYFDAAYTSELLVLFEARYFDVLDVNDLEERHEWSLLMCAERGTTSNEANH